MKLNYCFINSFQIMFHNDSMQSYSHNEKTMRHKMKQSKSHKKTDVSKQTKYSKSKNSKFQKNHKHSKFKCINNVSDFLGPGRLTKHVGFLSKGKISNSISRIEKIMSKEVKARAQQDLQEVLKLSLSGKYKYKKNGNASYESLSLEPQSLQSIYKSPQYLNHKTRFASSSWKDKLQKSVGAATVNSVLASVHRPQKTSPVKELQIIARRVLLNTVHPFIKQANNLLFSDRSHINKMRNKLRCIRKRLSPATFEKTPPSIICENLQVSPNNKEVNHTQSSVEEDFQLNPIFTGDVIDQSDFTHIFPSVNEFTNDVDNLATDIDNDAVNLADDLNYSETVLSQAHSSIDGKSSITLVPTSPLTSEEDSPVWKLQLSPAKFVPELDSTPTIYFRHKMF